MVAGSWMNNDGLYLQYGTQKAVPEVAGDYLSYGANRVVEVVIDLTTLTSTAAIQSNTTFFPAGANFFIEEVDIVTEIGATSGTSFSVGLIQTDRSTIPSNYSTAFANAVTTTNVTTAGQKLILTQTSGSFVTNTLIGSSPSSTTAPYYITALASGTYATGKVRVRIYYHGGVGTITQ